MNLTAVFHTGFAVAMLVGFLALEGTARFAAFGLGAALFVAGVLAARRDWELPTGG